MEELKYLKEKLQREISYDSYEASDAFSTLLLNEQSESYRDDVMYFIIIYMYIIAATASCALPPPEQNEVSLY